MSTAKLFANAAARATRYMESIRGRRVMPTAEDIARLEVLGGKLPEDGEDPDTLMALLDDVGSPATVASSGGRYFGFVTGGALPATVAANWLATAWDQNSALFTQSP